MAAAALSEEQHFISDEWTVEIEKSLAESEEGVKIVKASKRVPRALTDAKQEAYISQMVSLGPYHFRTLHDQTLAPYRQRVNHLCQMDFYKLKSIRDATQGKKDLTSKFLTEVMNKASDFEEFYDWKINDEQKFGRMMMLDAFFLYQFLQNGLHVLKRESSQTEQNYSDEILMPTLTIIRCDIVKLENQIPLSLLKQIDGTLKSNMVPNFLINQISRLSSIQSIRNVNIEIYNGENHLLGCIHKYVSSLLQINNPQQEHDNPKNPTFCDNFIDMIACLLAFFIPHPARDRNDFLKSYNAKELTKAGIQFKSSSDKITFDKHSDTLFLPEIVISDTYTEVMMRNLLALEFNDANRPKNVTQYVELMDCLIDTTEDVALLRKSGVIKRHSMMITDEQVAKMSDGMARPLFFAGFEEHPQAIKSGIREALINKYYRSKVKNWWAEFSGEHLSKPWKALALCTAVLVVVLTAAQTFCAFVECQKK